MRFAVSAGFLLLFTLAGCSRSDDAKGHAASASASASPPASASAALATVTPACGTTGYVDATGDADRTVTWSAAISKDPKKCLKVKAGATVKWTSPDGFAVYPIVPGATGPSTSPIKPTSSGESLEARFDVPGFYPYACAKRGDMVGTVWVVPKE